MHNFHIHHVSHNICSSQKLWFLSASSPPCWRPPIFLFLEIKTEKSLPFWTFKEEFYNQSKLVLNDDTLWRNLYLCVKNFKVYFSKKSKDFSIFNALIPTILHNPAWKMAKIHPDPFCGEYDGFFPYNSSKIWFRWWLLVVTGSWMP